MNDDKPRLVPSSIRDTLIVSGYCSLCYEPFYDSLVFEDHLASGPRNVEEQFARHVQEKHPSKG